MWKEIWKKWDDFWIGGKYDDSKKHLSQSDKRFLLYGNFMLGICTVAFVVLLIGVNNLRIDRKNAADMDEVLAFGYDEISQTGIHISKSLGENKGLAEIERGNGIVSIHRMKTLFCDDCIRAILNTVKNQIIGGLVVYDTKKIFFIL